MYLRCFVGDHPTQWVRWVPWAEYCYNTAYHTTLHTTPFRVVYGRDPPRLLSYTKGTTKLAAVEDALQQRDQILTEVHNRLHQAQARMKRQYDGAHRELSFNPGEWVLLRLHPHKQLSLAGCRHHKLAQRFYGPYKILRRIGQVAYQLELPPHSRIHDVFHVSLLKKFLGEPPSAVPPLPALAEGRVKPTPLHIIRSRLNRGALEVLVQWEGLLPAEATWEPLDGFRQLYPEFELEDKLVLEGGSDVSDAFWGKHYGRRQNRSKGIKRGDQAQKGKEGDMAKQNPDKNQGYNQEAIN